MKRLSRAAAALLASSGAVVAVGLGAAPATAARPSGADCSRAATAKAVAAARATLHDDVSWAYQQLRTDLDYLGAGALDRDQTPRYVRAIRPLMREITTTYSWPVLQKLTTVAALRTRAGAWQRFRTREFDVDFSVALAFLTSGGHVDMTTPAAQKQIAEARAELAQAPARALTTAAGRALDRLPRDAADYSTMLAPQLAQLSRSDFSHHIPIVAQQGAILLTLFTGSAGRRYSDDVDVISAAVPDTEIGQTSGNTIIGIAFGRVRAATSLRTTSRVTTLDALAAARARTHESAGVVLPALTTCERVSLGQSKSELSDDIAASVASLRDARTWSSHAHIPAGQLAAYRHAMDVADRVTARAFSRAAVARLATPGAVRAMASRWVSQKQVLTDILNSLSLAASYSGGHLDPADRTFTFEQLRARLQDLASLGLDESRRLAALDRLPSDMTALSVVAQPVFERLALVDFSKHAEVQNRTRVVDAAVTSTPQARTWKADTGLAFDYSPADGVDGVTAMLRLTGR